MNEENPNGESKIYITGVIAHIDHGKTTLIDSLVASCGVISRAIAGDIRYLDTRDDEQERGITLKLSPIKIKQHYILDTPGHVDFESLIYSSAILSDNFLIIVDVNEGITPRTYTLVKFIDKQRSILVLNKIEKDFDFDQILSIVYQINNLLHEEVFIWERNNIIISSAVFCAGTNYNQFKLSKKSTLKGALKAFEMLNKKIEKNDLSNILSKYKIRVPTKKNLFSSVFPLASTVFDSIESLPEVKSKNWRLKSDFYYLDDIESSIGNSQTQKLENFEFIAITVYSILQRPLEYKHDNLLFLTRILKGKIRRGDTVTNMSNTESKKVEIKKIFNFSINEYSEIEEAHQGMLVYISGDFLMNSILVPNLCKYGIKTFPGAFSKYKITPIIHSKPSEIDKAFDVIDNLKIFFRVMGFTEPSLKVRKNRYSEFELSCSGQVQFEKICTDLKANYFGFEVKEAKKLFREFARESIKKQFKRDEISIEIEIKPYSNVGKNKFNIYSENKTFVESVLEIFCNSGSLIKEAIIDTEFTIKFDGEVQDPKIFSLLKNEVSKTYLKANPSICPMVYQLKISVEQRYLGVSYTILQKYFYKMDDEIFDEDSEFFKIICRIPQFFFKDFSEDLRIQTKGTAYLEVKEFGYCSEIETPKYIEIIQREKGMFQNDKIVENPEKQRTLKK